MDCHGRIFGYSILIYENAVKNFNLGRMKNAEHMAAAAASAANFVRSDSQSPPELAQRAAELTKSSMELTSAAVREQHEKFGSFMSGPKKADSVDHMMSSFMQALDSAASEACR